MAKKKSPPPSSAPLSKNTGPMDPALLEQLVKLMSANDLSTLDLRDGPKRILLKRGAEYVPTHAAPVYHAPAPVAAPSAGAGAASGVAGGSGSSAASAADADAGLIPIKSPMVGTFYAAPSADAKPFVTVGASVNEETDVCIIEAMKVFNSIKAEVKGTIAKVLVQNAQTVEFGTVLFLVKP
jgi:acetyl-CoA carboxylase biotin carboxyl carrier protein